MIEENFRFRHGEEEIPVRVRSNSSGDISVSIVLDGVVHDSPVSKNFQSEGNGFFRGTTGEFFEKEIGFLSTTKAGTRKSFFRIEKFIWKREAGA